MSSIILRVLDMGTCITDAEGNLARPEPASPRSSPRSTRGEEDHRADGGAGEVAPATSS